MNGQSEPVEDRLNFGYNLILRGLREPGQRLLSLTAALRT